MARQKGSDEAFEGDIYEIYEKWKKDPKSLSAFEMDKLSDKAFEYSDEGIRLRRESEDKGINLSDENRWAKEKKQRMDAPGFFEDLDKLYKKHLKYATDSVPKKEKDKARSARDKRISDNEERLLRESAERYPKENRSEEMSKELADVLAGPKEAKKKRKVRKKK